MRAAGSARIIHEKLLCAMGKPFRRKATSGILNGKGKFSVAVSNCNIYHTALGRVLSSISHNIHDSPDNMIVHDAYNRVAIFTFQFFLPVNLMLINIR